jgi:hypothetical protein
VRIPSADEIAAALGKDLKVPSPAVTPTPQMVPQLRPTPTPTPATNQASVTCRVDHLSECTDKQLEEWGKPLVDQMSAVVDRHMVDLKQLDDIKEGNWIKEFVGIGDKTSRWLKAYAAAQNKTAEEFRNCCAEDALAYYKELAHRAGSGFDNEELYDWIGNLMRPVKSKEYKKPRDDAGKIISVLGNIKTLQIELQLPPTMRGRYSVAR